MRGSRGRADLHDRTDIALTHRQDCKTGKRFSLLCIITRCHRCQKQDHDKYQRYGGPREGGVRHSVRDRFWHLHAGAGTRDGGSVGRRDRGKRDRQDYRPTWKGLHRAGVQVHQRHEGGCAGGMRAGLREIRKRVKTKFPKEAEICVK